jgi:hypothetical protein
LDDFISLPEREAADADATGSKPHDVFFGLTRYMPQLPTAARWASATCRLARSGAPHQQ